MPNTQPDGHLALPPTGTGPGVLVLHAWWGLNDTLRAFCNRLADAWLSRRGRGASVGRYRRTTGSHRLAPVLALGASG